MCLRLKIIIYIAIYKIHFTKLHVQKSDFIFLFSNYHFTNCIILDQFPWHIIINLDIGSFYCWQFNEWFYLWFICFTRSRSNLPAEGASHLNLWNTLLYICLIFLPTYWSRVILGFVEKVQFIESFIFQKKHHVPFSCAVSQGIMGYQEICREGT